MSSLFLHVLLRAERAQVDYDAFVRAIQPPDVTVGRALPTSAQMDPYETKSITQRRHSVSSSVTTTAWSVDEKHNLKLRSKVAHARTGETIVMDM